MQSFSAQLGLKEFRTHHVLHAPPLTKDTFPPSVLLIHAAPPHLPLRSERGVNSLLPGNSPCLKAGRDLEEALKGEQKEDDLACTAWPRSDLLKMTHRDPKTRALHLTCCSCSVRELTSCFRLPAPFIGTQAPPQPTNSLAPGIRRTAATASRRTKTAPPRPQALWWCRLARTLRPWPFVCWPSLLRGVAQGDDW